MVSSVVWMKAVVFGRSSVLPHSCLVSWDKGCGLQKVLHVAPKFLSGLDEGCDLQKVFCVAPRLFGELGQRLWSSKGPPCCTKVLEWFGWRLWPSESLLCCLAAVSELGRSLWSSDGLLCCPPLFINTILVVSVKALLCLSTPSLLFWWKHCSVYQHHPCCFDESTPLFINTILVVSMLSSTPLFINTILVVSILFGWSSPFSESGRWLWSLDDLPCCSKAVQWFQ